MNTHQLVLLTIIITVPNVSISGIEAMNPSIGHIAILINY